MISDIKQILAKIGLKDNEIPVYLACLESPAGLKVQEIARQTNIKRSTVNLVLARLIQKGFLSFYLEGRRKVFAAESAEHILFNLQETANDFKGIIPLLQSKTEGGLSRVRFYEGEEEIKQVYGDIILTQKLKPAEQREILEIASGEDIFRVMPDQDKVFINKRVKEKIWLRWLAPQRDLVAQELLKTASQEYRDIRFFDSVKYPFHIDAIIYANKLMLMSAHAKPSAIIIEDKEITQSFRSVFNLLWDSLSKSKVGH